MCKCIRGCLRIHPCFLANKVYLNIIHLWLSNSIFQRKIHAVKQALFIWKDMMDDSIQRTINIPHSINEDEQVYAVLLDNISFMKARQFNRTPTLFKNGNTTKTVQVSKHHYTCQRKICFPHSMKNNYRHPNWEYFIGNKQIKCTWNLVIQF